MMLGLAHLPGVANADCSVNGTRGQPGVLNTIGMSASAGTPCAVAHWTLALDKETSRTLPQTRLAVEKGPRHGSVKVHGSRLLYTARPDFKGTDHFVYVSDNSTRGDPNFRYRVDIEVY
jgi:hypothetical protein